MRRALIVVLVASTVAPSAWADKPVSPPHSDVAKLIEGLATRDFHVRDSAQKALAELGPEALPELQKARASGDPEVRRRLDELIPPLARKLALSPKLITLHMVNRPIRDVLNELGRQTGYKIGTWPEEQPSKDPTVFTFHLDKVPFWQAMDQICEAGGLILQQGYGDDTLRVYAQDSYVPFTSYNGPFRVVAMGFNYSRNNQFGQLPRNGFVQQPGQRDNLQLSLMIAVEPKLPMLRAGQIRILEAEDDEHHSMLTSSMTGPNDPFSRRYYYPGGYRSFLHSSQAPLMLASKSAHTVKKVRGIIPVTIVSEQTQLLVTDRLLTAKGKKFKVAGATFNIEDVSEQPGKQYQIRLSITEDSKNGINDGSLVQSIQQRMQIQDDKCAVRQFNLMSINMNNNNSMQFTFNLMPPAANAGLPNRLVYLAWETLDHDVEFEFRDLPLP